jgi:vancomycin resistance protein VanJ
MPAAPAPSRENTKKKPARRLSLRKIAFTHLALVPFVYLGAEYIGEGFWLTSLLTYAPALFLIVLLLVPLIVLIPLAIRARDRMVLGANIAAALLTLPLLRITTGKPQMASPGTKQIRVLTYNIEHGAAGAEQVATFIRDTQADIICLQEVDDPALDASAKVPDPLPALKSALPDYHIERATELVVASRYPIKQVRTHVLPKDYVDRVAMEAVLDVEGKPLTVFSIHLNTAIIPQHLIGNLKRLDRYMNGTSAVRSGQINAILAATDKVSGPLLVCGDFNTPPRGQFYNRLRGHFTDTYAATATGTGWTFPSRRPLLRIDYVWLGGGVRPLNARVLASPASDHLPLLTEISLP